ncbi:MAG: FeS-binding protein, partial [Cyclobacteriaceae bacterium]|nr:FeS-binding protein [Cyclobacteriaceae bacterium]
MQFIRIVGLSIFLTALFLFISLLFVSDYTLTKEIFETKVKVEHQERLLPQFEKIFDKNYSTTFTFSNEIKNTVENVNAEARAQQQWDKVIYDDYIGSLTKASTQGIIVDNTLLLFLLIFLGGTVGALLFILPKISLEKPGIKHNNIFHHALNNRGWIGILLGTLLILFYILLYFYDAYVTNWIILVEPLKKLINPTGDSSQWFLYG